MAIPGLMQDNGLMISSLISYAAEYHGHMDIVSRTVEGPVHRYTNAQAKERSKRLINALINQFDIQQGDRTGTLAWTVNKHLKLHHLLHDN